MRVLYVEDDPMNRSVVRDMLAVVGAVMIEAPDAETGLELLDTDNFNIILMDLRMPGMDGLTAIGRIRQRNDEKGQLPIIVVTADTSTNLREQCLDGGADDVILKPIAMSKLLKSLTAMLSRTEVISRAKVA